MKAKRLSRELREGSGGFLENRRVIVGLTLAAIGSMGIISLYQMGLIDHLPEPPVPGLDADEVDASEQAYATLDTPDAVIGLRSYATTLGLVAMGGKDRARERPWIPLLLAGKAAFDLVQAGRLTYDQWAEHRAFCSWCLLAAGATLGTAAFVVPEATEAWRQLAARIQREGIDGILDLNSTVEDALPA